MELASQQLGHSWTHAYSLGSQARQPRALRSELACACAGPGQRLLPLQQSSQGHMSERERQSHSPTPPWSSGPWGGQRAGCARRGQGNSKTHKLGSGPSSVL